MSSIGENNGSGLAVDADKLFSKKGKFVFESKIVVCSATCCFHVVFPFLSLCATMENGQHFRPVANRFYRTGHSSLVLEESALMR